MLNHYGLKGDLVKISYINAMARFYLVTRHVIVFVLPSIYWVMYLALIDYDKVTQQFAKKVNTFTIPNLTAFVI